MPIILRAVTTASFFLIQLLTYYFIEISTWNLRERASKREREHDRAHMSTSEESETMTLAGEPRATSTGFPVTLLSSIVTLDRYISNLSPSFLIRTIGMTATSPL